MGKIRAISDQERRAKKRRILDAAHELFLHWSFQDISIQRIADSSGLAKGTVYLYFATKEELFLALFDLAVEKWRGDFQQHLDEHQGPLSADKIGFLIASTLSARPILIRFFALRNRCLNGDIGPKAASAHLQKHHHHLTTLASSLVNHTQISANQTTRWLHRIEAVISGLAQQERPEATGDDIFSLDFESELRDIATVLLEHDMKMAG